MVDPLTKRLREFVDAGWELEGNGHYQSWLRRLLALLRSAGQAELADELSGMSGPGLEHFWSEYRDEQIGHLEGKLLRADMENATVEQHVAQASAEPRAAALSATKVFVVHGHDVSAKESTARFLEKLGLDAVVLHEKANEGQTVIEKFELHSNVGFAVVLLTPDDVGAAAAAPDRLHGRARQNVILELGYFTGKLGRRRVCGLFRPGVEIPSDFHGVLFIEMDEAGGWKAKLAQELVSASMKINVQGLLHG